MKIKITLPWLCAILIPLAYLFLYTPYGMDTTDFGYFYGYAWRILKGQMPYRDFTYIKPAFPLYWHAFWMWLAPQKWLVFSGKAGFWLTMLLSSWLGALFLNRVFSLPKMRLPLPLLATCGFVFGVHSFPHMPWHTPDGVLFCSAALYAAICGHPVWASLFASCGFLCKQSFLLVPLALAIFLWLGLKKKRQAIIFAAATLVWLGLAVAWLVANEAFVQFRAQTTGQLAISEALDAGILIYLRQNWLIPALAILPWLSAFLFKKRLPEWLDPCYCYLLTLAIWYIYTVFTQQTWIGFGASWPTLFMLMGGLCVFWPQKFLLPWTLNPKNTALVCSLALGCSLLVAWSAAISGGYKIPAFFATPLVFCFFLMQPVFKGGVRPLAWATLACGLLIFACGYRYPYVFPQRPLAFSDYKYDAGDIFPQASGVIIDRQMYDKLKEFKELRAKYGPDYKTLPGFPMSYFLAGDVPVYGSDWLIDWEINGAIDKFYQELIDKKLTVFMERDQMDTAQADSYARAGYGVPQLVRKNWRIVEETPNFVVFQPPL